MVDVKTGVHNVLNYLVRCSIIEHVLFNSRYVQVTGTFRSHQPTTFVSA
jgi:hypothetical protein